MKKDICKNYRHLNSGTMTNLFRVLNNGKLSETGRFIIFDTDFACQNSLIDVFGGESKKHDPSYYFYLANKAKLSAIMGSLSVIESIASEFPAKIPLILRLNSGNSLNPEKVAVTKSLNASVKDALRIGASAVCFTLYTASERSYEMMEDLKDVITEAHENGLPVIVEILPKGGFLSRIGENALDIVALSVRIAAELGADIIKTPFPSEAVENPKAKKAYEDMKFNLFSEVDRLNHLSTSAFNSKRIIGITSLENELDKTVVDTNKLAKSECEGLFISSSLIKNIDEDKAVEFAAKLVKILSSDESNF